MSIQNLKKLGISLFVIVLFIVYSVQQRSSANKAPVPATAGATSSGPSSSNLSVVTSGTSGNASSSSTTADYKDGTYTGMRADAFYGYIQVQATVSSGKITDITFLEYPNDHHESVKINQRAMPLLKQEAISAQSAAVDGVSGATDTSQAFIESLKTALSKAV